MKIEARFAPLRCVPQPASHTEAQQVADAALSRWREIFAAISPIIGHRGVGALLKRSQYLNQGEHHCLAATCAPSGETVDLAALHTALRQQAAETAVAAQAALLQTFVDLLGRLIGPALTDHLIGSAAPTFPTISANRSHPQ